MAQSEIGALSSPQRQLYYLGGLLATSSDDNIEIHAIDADNESIWDEILNASADKNNGIKAFFLYLLSHSNNKNKLLL
ncbi:MAG: hypothetical protein J7574_14290 [Flavobacterium sp.]|uniref:hypothetical protein n=1 Tax=Flavobacterium sp. TaxID=239 RepID=UPI001B1A4866|nr:hypothetical protein [Flavobacterium sp.]MBO9585328.1 hypothetical protein [Flavobacterium sp.]